MLLQIHFNVCKYNIFVSVSRLPLRDAAAIGHHPPQPFHLNHSPMTTDDRPCSKGNSHGRPPSRNSKSKVHRDRYYINHTLQSPQTRAAPRRQYTLHCSYCICYISFYYIFATFATLLLLHFDNLLLLYLLLCCCYICKPCCCYIYCCCVCCLAVATFTTFPVAKYLLHLLLFCCYIC